MSEQEEMGAWFIEHQVWLAVENDQLGSKRKTELIMEWLNAARQQGEAEGRRKGLKEAETEAVRHVHANDPMGNFLYWIRARLTEKD